MDSIMRENLELDARRKELLLMEKGRQIFVSSIERELIKRHPEQRANAEELALEAWDNLSEEERQVYLRKH